MYLAQEMYDLVTCTYFPYEVAFFTGQSRTSRKPDMLYLKYVVLVPYYFDNNKSPYGFGMESGPTGW